MFIRLTFGSMRCCWMGELPRKYEFMGLLGTRSALHQFSSSQIILAKATCCNWLWLTFLFENWHAVCKRFRSSIMPKINKSLCLQRTNFYQPRGLSSVNKSMTISPRVVSRRTDIFPKQNQQQQEANQRAVLSNDVSTFQRWIHGKNSA